MLTNNKKILLDSLKLEFLRKLFFGLTMETTLSALTPEQMMEAHRFFWEKAVEFGIRSKGKDFKREEITARFTPISHFQKKMNCQNALQKCKGTDCFYTNAECAMLRSRQQIQAMCEAIFDMLEIKRIEVDR
jgi:hypothetical protein